MVFYIGDFPEDYDGSIKISEYFAEKHRLMQEKEAELYYSQDTESYPLCGFDGELIDEVNYRLAFLELAKQREAEGYKIVETKQHEDDENLFFEVVYNNSHLLKK